MKNFKHMTATAALVAFLVACAGGGGTQALADVTDAMFAALSARVTANEAAIDSLQDPFGGYSPDNPPPPPPALFFGQVPGYISPTPCALNQYGPDYVRVTRGVISFGNRTYPATAIQYLEAVGANGQMTAVGAIAGGLGFMATREEAQACIDAVGLILYSR